MMTVALLTLGLIVAPQAGSGDAEASVPEKSEEMTFEQLCAREVEELHQFFHDWFLGELPDTDEAFSRFASVMAEEFVIISPSGNVSERDELLDRLREAHGSAGSGAGIKIWIRGFKVRFQTDSMVVVNYEEWQERGSERTGRVSTAVLRRAEGKPLGVEWVHLHETWLPR